MNTTLTKTFLVIMLWLAATAMVVAGLAVQDPAESEERLVEEADETDRKRNGFHCLSGWDGSHSGVVRHMERRLRDPDSFEHISTRITPVNEKGQHALMMEYRARNGFGGFVRGVTVATISHYTCRESRVS